MAIQLYGHNMEAYRSAMTMLLSEGKAAVIHPTGTGKSFIGFKLCEDHPDERVCWLSPSKYIFHTQLENLMAASGGYRPDNVEFITYAKLMNMTGEEIGRIRPDYIILDEFHRCGASAWGQGVDRLLERYDGTPLLGLSATAIRYLDGQRDMSDELFDGHIASKMTLGEAIVRGILNPPVYVQTVYSYADDIDRYMGRVGKIRNRERRRQAEDILGRLKRALDKAEGLDEMFDEYMTDRTGKYIVFCANYGAMLDAMGKCREWFHRIDGSPRCYSLYSDDPGASGSFRAFKADVERDHLRLLFCIDALNEGIHVEDISGVVLLRPTISPVVYKQQIGRALSASKKTEPVVFDVVNNIENLYSIDAVREEMELALLSMRDEGKGDRIVNDTFEVIGQLKDCIHLFDELEGTLTASWEDMYREAERYHEEHGDLLPAIGYETGTGYALGRWVSMQRRHRRDGDPALTPERIEKLDAIGMSWDPVLVRRWMGYYARAERYYEEHGDLVVPSGYETDGLKLGAWISSQRESYALGRLSDGQVRLLDGIGMSWDRYESKWEKGFGYCKRYVEEHGDINDVPADFEYDGHKLAVWIRAQRYRKRIGKLAPERIARLESIGFAWDKNQASWEKGYAHAAEYLRMHGSLKMPRGYVCEDGFKLKYWLNNQQTKMRNGKLGKEQTEKLMAIGVG